MKEQTWGFLFETLMSYSNEYLLSFKLKILYWQPCEFFLSQFWLGAVIVAAFKKPLPTLQVCSILKFITLKLPEIAYVDMIQNTRASRCQDEWKWWSWSWMKVKISSRHLGGSCKSSPGHSAPQRAKAAAPSPAPPTFSKCPQAGQPSSVTHTAVHHMPTFVFPQNRPVY